MRPEGQLSVGEHVLMLWLTAAVVLGQLLRIGTVDVVAGRDEAVGGLVAD
jgi:hypothetical protein